MRINPFETYGRMTTTQSAASRSVANAGQGGAGAAAGSSKRAAELSLSAEARALIAASRDNAGFDAAKVEALRDQVEKGTYQVDSRLIADRMLEDSK